MAAVQCVRARRSGLWAACCWLLLLLARPAWSASASSWRDTLDHGKVRGFPSYEEASALLEKWCEDRPGELSRQEIGTSFEKRPIYAYVLASNSSQLKRRPQVLLTSMLHAREPAGLTVLLFFIGYLLQLFSEGDPEATSVLMTRELWTVPFVNPDGYVENERLVEGGVSPSAVLVRKNRRPTCATSMDSGVDLNRNFGVHWRDQFDQCNEEYQGSEPFSEPETRALKELCEGHDFKAAINFHSFGGMLTHPYNWATDQSLQAEDQAVYSEIAAVFGWDKFGPAMSTVGYTTTGESDDWMYGERGIISMSPEVGPEEGDFWPPAKLIAGINERNFDRIKYVVHKAGLQLSAGWQSRAAVADDMPDGVDELPGGPPQEVIELRLQNSGLSGSAGEAVGVAVSGLVDAKRWQVDVADGNDGPAALVRQEGSPSVVAAWPADGGTSLAFEARSLDRRSDSRIDMFLGHSLEAGEHGDLRLCVAEVYTAPAKQHGDASASVVCQCVEPTVKVGLQMVAAFAVGGGSGGAGGAPVGAGKDQALCDAAAMALSHGNQEASGAPAPEGKFGLRAGVGAVLSTWGSPPHGDRLLLCGTAALALTLGLALQAFRRQRLDAQSGGDLLQAPGSADAEQGPCPAGRGRPEPAD